MIALEQKFEDLIVRIDDAIIQVEEGKLVDFVKLNTEITTACMEAQNSGPEIAAVVKPQMGKLISKLDELAQGITAYQTRLMEIKAGKKE